jgi:hypothetical protein
MNGRDAFQRGETGAEKGEFVGDEKLFLGVFALKSQIFLVADSNRMLFLLSHLNWLTIITRLRASENSVRRKIVPSRFDFCRRRAFP